MGYETGKSAKKMGKVHPRNGRKFEKPVAKAPAGVSPHKVPRRYAMIVTTRTERVQTETHRFETKQARDQAKLRIEKENRVQQPWGNWGRGNSRCQTTITHDYQYADETYSSDLNILGPLEQP